MIYFVIADVIAFALGAAFGTIIMGLMVSNKSNNK